MTVIDLYKQNTIQSSVPPIDRITPEEIIKRIKSEEYKEPILKIRQHPGKEGKETRDKLKKLLPYVTWSGNFEKRAKEHLIEGTGLVCLDIDRLQPDEMQPMWESIISKSFTYFAFVSPSGDGFKIGVKIPIVQDDEEYKAYWRAVKAIYNSSGKIDESGKDIARACFLSYDANAYFNPEARICKGKITATKPEVDTTQVESEIVKIVAPFWKPGHRQNLALCLCAALRKKGYGINTVKSIFDQIIELTGDKESYNERINTIKNTFMKDENECKAFSGLSEILDNDSYKKLCASFDVTIEKEEKKFAIRNVTKHLKLYKLFDKALGLQGDNYNSLRKALLYSILGNTIKDNDKSIGLWSTKFDTRDSIAVFGMSNSGKSDIKRIMLQATPRNKNNKTTVVTSLHAEQLIGKVVTKKNGPKQPISYIHNKGYFYDDVVVFDESRSLFTRTRNGQAAQTNTELRKLFCMATDTMGDNMISKRLVEHDKDNALKYYARCSLVFLTQPVEIIDEVIESGFMRRLTLLNVKSFKDPKKLFHARIRGEDKTIYTEELRDRLTELSQSIELCEWSFENIEDAMYKYVTHLLNYGMAYSEKCAYFVKEFYVNSLFNKLLKNACIAAIFTRGEKRVTIQDVEVAYMDMFEILTNSFECIELHCNNLKLKNMDYPCLSVLRWVKSRKAYDAKSSEILLEDLYNRIQLEYGCSPRASISHYNKMREKDLICVKRGKTHAKIYLSAKSIDMLTDDQVNVDHDFYTDYLKICDRAETGEYSDGYESDMSEVKQ